MYRQAANKREALFPNPMRTILDGQLLFKFMHLSKSEQHDIAKLIGTSPDRILNDLLEIQLGMDVI